MSYAMSIDAAPFPAESPRRAGGPPTTLLASLAVAAIVTGLSGASLTYAFTHIAEVDPDAEAPAIATVAELTAQAPATPSPLEVLTPPVYGPNLVSEAPAAPFVPLNARVPADTVDLAALAQTDGAPPPCADPCSAQAGYEPPESINPDNADQGDAAPTSAVTPDQPAAADNDDGNAPPPPDMVVN